MLNNWNLWGISAWVRHHNSNERACHFVIILTICITVLETIVIVMNLSTKHLSLMKICRQGTKSSHTIQERSIYYTDSKEINANIRWLFNSNQVLREFYVEPPPTPAHMFLTYHLISAHAGSWNPARLGPSAQLREWFVFKSECTRKELSFFRKGSDLIKTSSYSKKNSLSRRVYAGEYMHASESQ